MATDMTFNGVLFTWVTNGGKTYRGTSGLPGYQSPKFETVPDNGPIPTGTYRIPIYLNGSAQDDGSATCRLESGWGLQAVPGHGSHQSYDGQDCWDAFWQNWGPHRLQLTRKTGTANAAPNRSGFYLHDSGKGFSHGCIEIESSFFVDLKNWIRSKPTKIYQLELQVSYSDRNMITNGNTGSRHDRDAEIARQRLVHGG